MQTIITICNFLKCDLGCCWQENAQDQEAFYFHSNLITKKRAKQDDNYVPRSRKASMRDAGLSFQMRDV
jgi:hypothetical protein